MLRIAAVERGRAVTARQFRRMQHHHLDDVETLRRALGQISFGFLAGQAREHQPAGIAEPEERLAVRSEEHTSELQSLMRNSYAVFCLKKKKLTINKYITIYRRRTRTKYKHYLLSDINITDLNERLDT